MTTRIVISNVEGPLPVQVTAGEKFVDGITPPGQFQRYVLRPGECIVLVVAPHHDVHVKEIDR